MKIELQRRHATLVGIDSDGCVFDTMAVKQREFFHPAIIRHWRLEPVAGALRECAEFVNLASKTRGSNRFPALLRTFELLAEHPAARAAQIALPDTRALRAYVNAGLPLGDPSLRQEAERTGDPELARILAWSLELNAAIDSRMRPVPPFAGALSSLKRIHAASDALVVSQTPLAALRREWELHDLCGYVGFIAGQEHGGKAEHLRQAAGGHCAPGRVLLIGDAQGDLDAARLAGALFYPIMPGAEEESWRLFHDEAYDRFLQGAYAGEYAGALVDAFEALLPQSTLANFQASILRR